MQQGWRRQVTAAAGSALLALHAHRADQARADEPPRRCASPSQPFAASTTRYYLLLLAGVRAIAALVVAAAVWRIWLAHALAAAGERTGYSNRRAPPASAACAARRASGLRPSVRPRSGISCRPTPLASPRADGRCSRRGCTPTRCRSSPSARSCSRSVGARSATGSPTSRTTPPRHLPAPPGCSGLQHSRLVRASSVTTAHRAASSGSPSSPVRLRFAPDPRQRPRRGLSGRPTLRRETWNHNSSESIRPNRSTQARVRESSRCSAR